MYTKFFGFKEKPFTLVPNPNYLYLTSKHEKALTFLEYGITEKVGFILLTGEIGIGKTTLIRHFLNQNESDMEVALISNTNFLSNDLIKSILNEFEIQYEDGIPKAKALDKLNDFIIQRYFENRKVLLIIDEAQNLSDEALEEIRMLSNLQTDDDLLIQIMIVGQPNLRDRIQEPNFEQFAQRISVSYHIDSMTLEETEGYINHRVNKAGGNATIFPEKVINKIFEVSKGIPRTINLLCDAALIYGYAEDSKVISLDILNQVIQDNAGIGIFTTKKQTKIPEQLDYNDAFKELEDKTESMEVRIDQLTEKFDAQVKSLEEKAKFDRNKTVSNLKQLLKSERKRSATYASEYGKLKKRYKVLLNSSRSKKIKKVTKVI